MAGSGPKQVGSADMLDPVQRQLLEAIGGSADIAQFFNPEVMSRFFEEQVSAPTMQQFREQFIPEIQEQFIGAGAANSSGLNQALAKAASDVQSGLSAQRSAFQQQGQQNQLALIAQALGLNATQPLIQEGSNPLGSALGLAGYAAGSFLGGPGGGALGSKLFGAAGGGGGGGGIIG